LNKLTQAHAPLYLLSEPNENPLPTRPVAATRKRQQTAKQVKI